MPKLKRLENKQKTQTTSLKDFLDTYDALTLHTALESFVGSTGWELIKAYARFTQRQYEVQALDKLGTGENNQVAAYASGYAKACDDVASFVDGLRKTILGSTGVIEVSRPEE